MKTLIYGSSDDLIEIDGAWSEEYYLPKGQAKISCSDGTEAQVTYDGNWHFKILKTGYHFERIVNANPSEEPHTDEDCKKVNASAYSDVLIFKEPLTYIVIGRKPYRKPL